MLKLGCQHMYQLLALCSRYLVFVLTWRPFSLILRIPFQGIEIDVSMSCELFSDQIVLLTLFMLSHLYLFHLIMTANLPLRQVKIKDVVKSWKFQSIVFIIFGQTSSHYFALHDWQQFFQVFMIPQKLLLIPCFLCYVVMSFWFVANISCFFLCVL